MSFLQDIFCFFGYSLIPASHIQENYLLMSRLAANKFVTIEEHDERITHLLEANNKGVEERRLLVSTLKEAGEAIDQLLDDVEKLTYDLDIERGRIS